MVNNYESLASAVFDVCKSGSNTYVLTHRDKTKETLGNLTSQLSSVFWIGELHYGVYYLHEKIVPSGYTGTGSTEGRWFFIVIGDDTIPGGRNGVFMSDGFANRDEGKAAYDSYKAGISPPVKPFFDSLVFYSKGSMWKQNCQNEH